MNPLIRWAKFNLVGAIGMAVQLTALALFNRILRGHYLYASAAAIELTLLHNFTWHLHYTWRDRRDRSTRLHQLLRFHLSNGLVSMLGNLALMRLLIHHAHLPLLSANIIAILTCSLANFCLANTWAFTAIHDGTTASKTEPPHSLTITFALVLLLMGTTAHAQTHPTPQPDESTSSTGSSSQTPGLLPQSPAPQSTPRPQYHATPNQSYVSNAGVFCGIGASTSPVSTKPTTGCGAGMTFVPLPIFLEVGLMAPQANRSNFSAYISVDGNIPVAPLSSKYLPLAIVGYSRLFETGHALDYGLALALPRFGKQKDNSNSLRIELRDYWTFANPAQHNVMLRIGWMEEVND